MADLEDLLAELLSEDEVNTEDSGQEQSVTGPADISKELGKQDYDPDAGGGVSQEVYAGQSDPSGRLAQHPATLSEAFTNARGIPQSLQQTPPQPFPRLDVFVRDHPQPHRPPEPPSPTRVLGSHGVVSACDPLPATKAIPEQEDSGALVVDHMEVVVALLRDAFDDWNPQGRPDASGAMIGGSVAIKLEEISGTVKVAWQQYGQPKVLTGTGQLLAVGTTLGVAVVVQVPLGPAAPRESPPGSAQGEPATWYAGEPKSESEGVTSLGFSHVHGPGDALWLIVGHASGLVNIWEMQKRGPKLVTTIHHHGLPIVHASFFPGRGTSMAITADRRGRVALHTFTNMLLRTAVASRVLLEGQYGSVLSLTHLVPFLINLIEVDGAPSQETLLPSTPSSDHQLASGERTSSSQVPDEGAVRPTRSQDDTAGSGGGGGSVRVGEGMLAVCTPTACLVARVKHSGDIILMYSIPKPEDVRPDALPVASWCPHHRRHSGADVRIHGEVTMPCGLLALGWDERVVLFSVPLLGDHQTSQGTMGAGVAGVDAPSPDRGLAPPTGRQRSFRGLPRPTAAPANAAESLTAHMCSQLAAYFPLVMQGAWGEPQSSGQDELAQVVLGLHWFDVEALVTVMQQGLSTQLLLLEVNNLTVKEQVECLDNLVPCSFFPTSLACHGSVAGQGVRLFLLGMSGIYSARLMSWQERLKTLQNIGKMKLGLHLALQFYKLGRAKGMPGGAVPKGAQGGVTSGNVPRFDSQVSDPYHLQQWILALMLGYAEEVLNTVEKNGKRDGERLPSWTQLDEGLRQQVEQVSQIVVHLCMMTHQPQVLYDRAFPLFTRIGYLGPFLSLLEPHILREELEYVAPEVMQALVEHFSQAGQPERVEACVMHMNIASLDLDQVIRLCEQHHLYSALIYIYNRIMDFRKPLVDLLKATAMAVTRGEARQYGHLTITYLRCMFGGQAFPPGSGPLQLAAAQLDEVKATLMGVLLFWDTSDLAQDWRVSEEQVEALVSNPHPGLQILLRVDVAALMTMLKIATEGWDAVELDLRVAAGKQVEELGSVLIASQVVVNAVVALIETGKLCQLHQGRDQANSAAVGTTAELSQAVAVSLDFVTGLLAEGRVIVPGPFVLRVLHHIVHQAVNPYSGSVTKGYGSVVGSGVCLPEGFQEDLFVKVVQHVGVLRSGSEQTASGGEVDPRLRQEGVQVALQIASQAGFELARATIYHLLEDYPSELGALLGYRGQRQGVFDAILQALSDRSLIGTRRHRYIQAFKGVISALVHKDPDRTADIVLRFIPEEQTSLLGVLERQDVEGQLQFSYLNAIMRQSKKMLEEAGAYPSALAMRADLHLMNQPHICNLYVRLLCQFDPDSVLQFLRGHENYDVREVLRSCVQYKVAEAQAYLHERLGDLDAALKLYLVDLDTCHQGLEEALRSGKVPLLPLELAEWHSASEEVSSRPSSPPATAGPSTSFLQSTSSWLAQGLGYATDKVAGNLPAFLPALPTLRVVTNRAGARDGSIHSPAGSLSNGFSPPHSWSGHHHDQLLSSLTALSQPTSNYLAPSTSADPFLLAASMAGQLHLSWLTALSPKLVVHLPRDSCGGDSFYHGSGRAGSSYGPNVPPELVKCWSALQSCINFCQRNAKAAAAQNSPSPTTSPLPGTQRQRRDGTDPRRGRLGDADDVSGQWFALLEIFVKYLSHLKVSPSPVTHGRGNYPHSGSDMWPDEEDMGESVKDWLVSRALRDIYSALMGEVINNMADYVPLHEILLKIISDHAAEEFGDFRMILLGLFSAYHYEQSIMNTANRLITKDVYRGIQSGYLLRKLCREPPAPLPQASGDPSEDTGEQEGVEASTSSHEASTSVAHLTASVLSPPPLSPSRSSQLLLPGPGFSLFDSGHVVSAINLGILGQYAKPRDRDATPAVPLPSLTLTNLGGRAGTPGPTLHGSFLEAKDDLRPGAVYQSAIDIACEIARIHPFPLTSSSSAGGKVNTAPGAGSTSTFDIDELLSWSHSELKV